MIEVCRPTAKVGVAFERREGSENHVSVDVDVREIGAWSIRFTDHQHPVSNSEGS